MMVKQRSSKFEVENSRISPATRVWLKNNGCSACPHNGSDCPYKVGCSKYEQDSLVMGTEVCKAGDPIRMHAMGICPEREYELAEELRLCCSLTGLREKRAHSLMSMEKDISKIKQVLDATLEKQGMTINLEDGESDTGDSDKKLVEVLKEFISIHHKYHEKLDSAIQQEAKFVEAAKNRMSADDINDAMKLSKMVNVSEEKQEKV